MTRVITFVLLAGALCAPSVLPSSAYADGGQSGPGADPQALEDTHFFPDFELGPIMVSGWNFKTLQEAVDAIGSDSEVKGRTAVLIDNVEESITVPAGKELSIDLYAHRLSGTAGKPAITVKSGAKLTIEGSVTDSAVLFAPTPGTPALVIEPGASVVMESGSVKGAEGVTTPVVQNNGGTFVVLEGGQGRGRGPGRHGCAQACAFLCGRGAGDLHGGRASRVLALRRLRAVVLRFRGPQHDQVG